MSITIENIDDLSFEHIYETEDRDEVLQFVKTSEIDEFFVQQEDDTYYKHRNSDIEEYRDVVKVPGKHFGACLLDSGSDGREFMLLTYDDFNKSCDEYFSWIGECQCAVEHEMKIVSVGTKNDMKTTVFKSCNENDKPTTFLTTKKEYTNHNYKNVKIFVITRKIKDEPNASIYKFYDVTID